MTLTQVRVADHLVDLARRRGEFQGAERAYLFLADGEREATSLTWAELDRKARAVAARCQEMAPASGLVGERAVLLFPPGLDFLVGFLGCLYAGLVAVPVYPGQPRRQLPRLETLAQDAGASWVLTLETWKTRLPKHLAKGSPLASCRWLATDQVAGDDQVAESWRPPAVDSDSLALLQYTSGSTGSPKGVMIRHRHLMHNQSVIGRAFELDSKAVILGWLPMYHDMGLIGNVLHPLFLGASCVLMSPMAFLRRPRRWLEAITKYGATVSGGPNFAYELCLEKTDDLEGLDLSSWNVAFNGSETVHAKTHERFVERFAACGFEHRAFFPCYGLAEATLFVTGGTPTEAPTVRRFGGEADAEGAEAQDLANCHHVSCGRTRLGHQVLIVDPKTRRLRAAGEEGEIWISGPSVASGYWQRAEASREAFEAQLDSGEGPFLRTGDLGYWVAGELFVTGRLKELIILRGRNYFPQDLERSAEAAHEDLRPGGAIAFSVDGQQRERLVIVLEVRRRAVGNLVPETIDAKVRQRVVHDHGIAVDTVMLIRPGTLPRTTSGKRRRLACRQAFLDGDLEQVAPSLGVDEPSSTESAASAESSTSTGSPSADLRQRLATLAGLQVKDLEDDQAVSLDSLAAVELGRYLEERFGIASPPIDELLAGVSVARLVEAIAEPSSSGPQIAEATTEAEMPLSAVQQALWLVHQLEEGSAAQHIALALRLSDPPPQRILNRAWRELIERHEMLRTRFVERDGEPVQCLVPFAEIPEIVLRVVSAPSSKDQLEQLMAEAARQPFDLDRAPLLRVVLFEQSARDDAFLLLVLHHLVADQASLEILLREFGEICSALRGGERAELRPLRAPYSAYVRWHRELLESPRGEELWDFWRERLSGELEEAPPLPADRRRQGAASGRSRTLGLHLDPELGNALRALARDQGSTLFVTLLAGFKAVLARSSNIVDVITGAPMTGRHHAWMRDTVGYMVNVVALRVSFANDPKVSECLARTREAVLSALVHQDYPFTRVVERLRVRRERGRSPLFQAFFSWRRASDPDREVLPWGPPGTAFREGGLEGETADLNLGFSPFDLNLTLGEAGEGVWMEIESAIDLWDPTTIDRFADHLRILLRGMAQYPETRLSELPLLSDAELHAVLQEQSQGATLVNVPACLPEFLEERARQFPEAVAIASKDGTCLSHQAVGDAAGALARQLRRAGVGPETLVGVLASSSLSLVPTLLGILRAGGAYVPIDPTMPTERLAFLIADTGLDTVLGEAVDLRQPGLEGMRKLGLATGPTPASLQSATPVAGANVRPDNLAYVIYTSGSTGRPKGVRIRHRTLVDFLRAMEKRLAYTSRDVLLAITSLSFDIVGLELFLPLLTGGRVVIAERGVSADGPRLAALMRRARATVLQATPTTWSLLANARTEQQAEPRQSEDRQSEDRQSEDRLSEPCRSPYRLRLALSGGEALSGRLASQLRELADQVWNLYGPTETTVWSTCERVSRASATIVSIGRPLDGTRVYAVDGAGRPVAIGHPGELWIGGRGLSSGYWRRPGLTAERFVPAFVTGAAGERLYRTGDLVRWLADGRLEFLGRVDHQVKVRGFRIELPEVESVLERHPEIQRAAVILGRRPDGDPVLIAHLVAKLAAPSVAELRRFVGRHLPEPMVPSAFVLHESLPRLSSGKIDRRRLHDAGTLLAPESHFVAPRNAREACLVEIWGELLGQERIGVRDSFFELGGHSLVATRMVSRVRERLGVELPLQAVFEAPTVEDLALRLNGLDERRSSDIRTPAQRGPRPELSFAQQRLWFLDQVVPGHPVYNVALAMALRGPLDLSRLRRGVNRIVERHEILRTIFPTEDGLAFQSVTQNSRVTQNSSTPFLVVDLLNLDSESRRREVDRLSVREGQRPFNIASGPLLRVAVLRCEQDRHRVLLNLHHIITDAWSMDLFLRELSTAYRDPTQALPEPVAQYADYAAWQRNQVERGAFASQMDYWRQQLAELPESPDLPTDRPRPERREFRGARLTRLLPRDLASDLRLLSQNHGATLFMTLLAGFASLLARRAGCRDLAIGTDVAGRNLLAHENLMGFCVNHLVLRVDLNGRPSFSKLVERVKKMAVAAFAHQDLPFDHLVRELDPQRDLAQNPFFQVSFVLQNAPLGPLELDDLDMERLPVDNGTAPFDLTFSLTETADGLEVIANYSTALYDATSIQRLLTHFETHLQAAATAPDQPVASLRQVSDAERFQLLAEWNETGEPDTPPLLHELFEAQARRRHDAVALIFKEQHRSYRQLDRDADRLASVLRARGVGPEVRVGLAVPRSPAMLVSLLAVLKAGGTYVPLDLAHPERRLAFILKETRPALILSRRSVRPDLPESTIPCLTLEDVDHEPVMPGTRSPAHGARRDNAMYVIYTSGSTGRPKGIVMRYGALAHLLDWACRRLTRVPRGRTLQFASLGFDTSLLECFTTWYSGGVVVEIPEASRRDPRAILDLMTREKVEKLFLPFVVLRQLAETGRALDRSVPALREVHQAGEALVITPDVAWFFRQIADCRLSNQYGPSEAPFTTFALLPRSRTAWPERPSIGRPIGSTRVHLLDASSRLVPAGIPGEVAIGGVMLARGYLGRAAQSAERFIPDPFSSVPGERLYRTGDRAMRLADGRLRFLGRVDDQVKVRGFRIEPGEIETALRQHDGVREAVVLAWPASGVDQRLVAWFVPGDSRPDQQELRHHLRRILPDFMVPNAFVPVERLPMNLNGKLDRRALPAPDSATQASPETRRAPRNTDEARLAEIWQQTLETPGISIDDSFFALGGHSILAARLALEISRAFGVDLPVRHIFEAPTIAELAERLQTAQREEQQWPPIVAGARQGELPLSFGQERLFFLDQLNEGDTSYNISIALDIAGPLERQALEEGLAEVLRRHDTLRGAFNSRDGQPVHTIQPATDWSLGHVDLHALPEARRQAEADRILVAEPCRPFDLARPPLLRATLLQLEERRAVLLIVVHHIAADGWSLEVLINEINVLYPALASSRHAARLEQALPEPSVQYADYARWQRRCLRGTVLAEQVEFWRRRLLDAPILRLPLDRPRPVPPTNLGAALPFRVPAALLRDLEACAQQQGVTLFVVLLVVFKALLARITGQTDICVGVPVANRRRPEIRDLIGFFVNTLVVRSDLSDRVDVPAVLRQVQRDLLEAQTYQDLPFDRLVRELGIARDASISPLFQVLFSLHRAPTSRLDLPELDIRPRWIESRRAKLDLTVEIVETEGELRGAFEYRTALFDQSTVARWARLYERSLEQLVRIPEADLASLTATAAAEEEARFSESLMRRKASNLKSLRSARTVRRRS